MAALADIAIYRRGSRWGDAESCCSGFEAMRKVVAVLFFFSCDYLR